MTPNNADKDHIHRAMKMQTAELSGTNAGTGRDSKKNSGPLDREAVLELSSTTIRSMHKRISSVRFKEQAGDRARIAHIRAFTALLQTYASILKDHEMADLERRITELEQQKEVSHRS